MEGCSCWGSDITIKNTPSVRELQFPEATEKDYISQHATRVLEILFQGALLGGLALVGFSLYFSVPFPASFAGLSSSVRILDSGVP